MTVITSQDIRAFGWRTLADLLRSVPGFHVIYPRTYGFVGVRGFGSPGDFGGRMLLLVNGHRLNDPLYDSAAVVEDFILDLDLVERVEIVRGPGSAPYGNNAFFAVVNVFLREAASVDGLWYPVNLDRVEARGVGTVALGVYNLFDRRYDDHAVGVLNTIAQDGRTFRLALRLAP